MSRCAEANYWKLGTPSFWRTVKEATGKCKGIWRTIAFKSRYDIIDISGYSVRVISRYPTKISGKLFLRKCV